MLSEWISALRLRTKMLFRRRQLDRDLNDELQFHLAMREQKLADAGMPADEARFAARREFGNAIQAKEANREIWTFPFIETLWQDLRFGLRQLRCNPGFTTVAVITLALGIGANTAIFNLIDAVMLHSMPVREPSQLVLFRWQARHGLPRNGESSGFGDCPRIESGAGVSGCSFPLPVLDDMRSEAKAFLGVAGFAGPAQVDLSGNGPPTLASGELVSGNYFSLLGVDAVVGRTIGPEDDKPTAPPVLVLSYSYWQRAFGGERSAVGRTIDLNDVTFTIVGVAEPAFTQLSPGKAQDFWMPVSVLPRLGIDWGRNSIALSNWWLVLVGRLRPSVSLRQAQAAAGLVFRNELLHGTKRVSQPQDAPSIALVPAQEGLTGGRLRYRKVLYVLMFAVSLVLLIACANVAGLLLSRAATRTREIAVRLAVGAGRARIIRQLLTESFLLAGAGGVLGIMLAYWAVHILTRLLSSEAGGSFPFAISADWRILLFTIALSLLSGITFGLAPAFRTTRVDLSPALKQGVPTGELRDRRYRGWFHSGNALVVAQVGLSAVVLAGAGLLVRTLQNLRRVNPGFETRNVLLFSVDPTLAGYKDAQIQNLYHTLRSRLSALPGVISVSYSSAALLTGGLWTENVHIEGQPEKKTAEVDMLAAGPEFMATLHIPLLEGRPFTTEDFEQAARAPSVRPVAVGASPAAATPLIPVLVNKTFVRTYFPNQNALGKRVNHVHGPSSATHSSDTAPQSRSWQIVGVVGDTKYSSLRRNIHPTVFVPFTGGGAHFELRTAANPTSLIATVRSLARRVDSHLPLFDVHTQSEKIDELLAQERLLAQLGSFFGALAVLLASLGLYGLLSYEVSRRTHALGVRMALGAQKSDVLKLVVGQGMTLTLMGVGIGIAVALGVTRFLSSLLYGVKPTDPLTFIAVSLLLVGVALLACYIPARRATKVDPMVALRHE
jgi:predicted permease